MLYWAWVGNEVMLWADIAIPSCAFHHMQAPGGLPEINVAKIIPCRLRMAKHVRSE